MGVFNSPDEAYALAGITFVELPEEALRKIKKRDREAIELFSKREARSCEQPNVSNRGDR